VVTPLVFPLLRRFFKGMEIDVLDWQELGIFRSVNNLWLDMFKNLLKQVTPVKCINKFNNITASIIESKKKLRVYRASNILNFKDAVTKFDA
jgi:hypothetical protein